MDKMNIKFSNVCAFLAYTLLVILPLWLAVDRLVWVAGFDPSAWISSLENNYISQGVIEFTFYQALISTIVTMAIGLPIAWQLGRYKWPLQSVVKAILTVPFVMPSIVAAMGFLYIVGKAGLDIRVDESTWFATLIIAHAWFNMALIIRFCEPVLSTLDPKLEEQMRLLPAGNTKYGRFRNLWLPLLAPSIAAAACMTFVFSFTSFALVRWITLGDNTLESVMAGVGSSAGIEGYMISRNEIVLGSSMIQFTILLISLFLMSWLQQKRQNLLPQASEVIVKKRNPKGWAIIGIGVLFSLSPLIAVLLASFRIRNTDSSGTNYSWDTSGWEFAFTSSNSISSAWEALFNSLGYAAITLIIAVPLGWILAQTIIDVEKSRPRLARTLDVLTMLPFAISSVMIGLGVMLGMIRIDAEFFYSFWPTPALAHIMITTPFVVRIMLPALRSIEPAYDECAKTLGITKWRRFTEIKLPLLKGSILVATIFTLAMSLGEFGASWVVTRNSDWTTLPVMIDSLRSIPYKNSLTAPAACAVSSVLMGITLILFTWAEKFRSARDGGMF
ncbi:MAG: iron ABC transporter permease [Candidatus Poseidoniales archaeon]|nr:MAG: iron ABC transporter permease [Candidatus Poseidoniales archaeon]